jgi:nucleoside 2-deoxyribosyltransferase
MLAQDMGVDPQRHQGISVAEAGCYDVNRDACEQRSGGVQVIKIMKSRVHRHSGARTTVTIRAKAGNVELPLTDIRRTNETDLDETPTKLRWFVSAPSVSDLKPLLGALRERGVSPYVLSDTANLGDSFLQNLRQAITTADRVVVVLAGGRAAALNGAFEAGVAAALGKSPIVIADPDTKVPADFSDFLVVRARPTDVNAITFALDHSEGKVPVTSRTTRDPAEAPLEPDKSQELHSRLENLHTASTSAVEQRFLDLLADAVELGGAITVSVPEHRDTGYDLAVWSDDLTTIGANPLLIELKQTLNRQAFRQAETSLRATPGAEAVLIVYIDKSAEVRPGVTSPVPSSRVWAIWIDNLLQQMESRSFAEVVRRLRNEAVHGPLPA